MPFIQSWSMALAFSTKASTLPTMRQYAEPMPFTCPVQCAGSSPKRRKAGGWDARAAVACRPGWWLSPAFSGERKHLRNVTGPASFLGVRKLRPTRTPSHAVANG